jgi:CheY-like chemotaxis protein
MAGPALQVSMAPPPSKCPRCSAPLTTPPDASGQLSCAQCGARLRARAPSAEAPKEPATAGEQGATPQLLEAILAELRVLRRQQEEVLRHIRDLRPPPSEEPEGEAAPEVTSPSPPVRSRRRKTVLLIDDDVATRTRATQALERAEVPVRAAADGRDGLSAIAAEKPDVIVLELGLGGSMAGKDVINMIKATMEWVDLPIVLFSRVPVESQKEARIVHGADEYVPKDAGPEALVAKVIQVFRRG